MPLRILKTFESNNRVGGHYRIHIKYRVTYTGVIKLYISNVMRSNSSITNICITNSWINNICINKYLCEFDRKVLIYSYSSSSPCLNFLKRVKINIVFKVTTN